MSKDARVIRLDAPPVQTVACRDCPLRRLEVFEPAGRVEIELIEELKKADLRYAPGERLVAENSHDGPLFTLLQGWALRYKTLPDGRRQILNIVLPGDFIGLQQKMTDQASHGVEALTEVWVCRFPRDAVWTLHRELPSLGYDVTWLSANEHALVDDNLLSVGRRNAEERVAALLLTVYARALPHDPDPGAVGLYFPLTQQHLADALGLSLVHTHRTFRSLRQKGLVEIRKGSRLVLHDQARLARLAHLRWPLGLQRRPLI